MKALSVRRLCVFMFAFHCFLPGQSQSISGVVNSYYKVTGVNTATSTLTVPSTGGLATGVKVLIIQMKGATINSADASTFGDITAIGNAGNYEFNVICSVSATDVVLKYPITRSYTIAGSVQLVTVPRYASVTITDTLKATPWNAASGTGGVVVIESSDTLYLNSAIDAGGKGFAGGALFNYTTPAYDCSWFYDVTDYTMTSTASGSPDYYTGAKKGEGIADYITDGDYGRGKQANGGGGGNNHNTGGAGGANFGSGGNGGQRSNEGGFFCHGTNPGIGGAALSSFGYTAGNNKIFMGGGGGSGHQNNNRGLPGGNGGGIAIVLANVISSSGQKIISNGASPVNALCNDPLQAEGDGGGGGGAGGTVIVQATQVVGNISMEAKGGNGSNSSYHAGPSFVNDCTGPGGGGGGGVVWISAASLPGTMTSTITAGSNGVVSTFSAIAACRGAANGATAGSAGSTKFSYTAPALGSVVCIPLPVKELEFFKGSIADGTATLLWRMRSTAGIEWYEVERSNDQLHYNLVSHIAASAETDLKIVDPLLDYGIYYYRIKFLRTNGTVEYSGIVPLRFDDPAPVRLRLYPNPAHTQMKINLFSVDQLAAKVTITDITGRKQFTRNVAVKKGNNNFDIPVQSLPAGVYLLTIDKGGTVITAKFTKTSE